jgi:hypothetical protein
VPGDRREPGGHPAEPLALTAGAADVAERGGDPLSGEQAAAAGAGPADATTSGLAGREDDEVTAPLPVVVPGVTEAKPDAAVSAASPADGVPAAPSEPAVSLADPVAGLADPAPPVRPAAAGRGDDPNGGPLRGPFEPLCGNGSAVPADPPGAAGDTGHAGSPSQDPDGVGSESGTSQSEPEAADAAAAAKLDQIKDLYLTAEAIGDDALAKHFQQVSERQRQLIREYFDEAIGRGAEDRAPE